MTGQQFVFVLVSVITLGSALMVVTLRNLFHAALAMMLSFLGIAGIFALLEAGFLAATQLLVYIGAISILIIFAIMMTRRLMSTTEPSFNSQWFFSIVGASVLFGVLSYVSWNVFRNFEPLYEQTAGPYGAPGKVTGETLDPSVLQDSVASMGEAFASANGYVIPFEVTSVLLLAALVGAIVIARPREEEE